MSYHVPLADIRFTLKELAGLDDDRWPCRATKTPTADLVDAVLRENARFVEEEVAPLNRAGDRQPAVWRDGAVTTTPGLCRGLSQLCATGGWQGVVASGRRWGGQGLPKLVAATAQRNASIPPAWRFRCARC